MPYDLIILGGGCAGLSLARRLSELGEDCPQTVILESRSSYTDDRTWCFWGEDSAQLTHLVRHRWSWASVAAEGKTVKVDCSAFPYSMIPSLAFYDESLEMISQAPQLLLEGGVSVLSEPLKVGNNWQVETSAGMRSARMVVDTRPLRTPQREAAGLSQSFVGHEIECAEPIFQPDVAELMHFEPVREGEILFFYLLPFAENRALIEATIFSAEPLGPDRFEKEMQEFITRRVQGASYTVRRSEHGILPMGIAPPQENPDASYVSAGLTTGAARPSSGYTFQRIQRWAADCAKALGAGLPPLAHARDPMLLRGMDAIFLRVLRLQPEIAPELFLALFQKVEIAILVRFMSDRGTLSDYATIASALPSGPFLRETFPALIASRMP
jgi:lycopene beta-cyclase